MGPFGTTFLAALVILLLVKVFGPAPVPASRPPPAVAHASWADASRRLSDYGATLRAMHAALRDRAAPSQPVTAPVAMQFR